MKKTHIIALLAIIAGIAIIISASKDFSSFSTFTEAELLQKEVKISGTLDLDKDIIYDPEVDPNIFTFNMIDKEGKSNKVILKSPKPQEFERSESIVATGKMEEGVFIASEILLKCPSKYKSEETRIRAQI